MRRRMAFLEADMVSEGGVWDLRGKIRKLDQSNYGKVRDLIGTRYSTFLSFLTLVFPFSQNLS